MCRAKSAGLAGKVTLSSLSFAEKTISWLLISMPTTPLPKLLTVLSRVEALLAFVFVMPRIGESRRLFLRVVSSAARSSDSFVDHTPTVEPAGSASTASFKEAALASLERALPKRSFIKSDGLSVPAAASSSRKVGLDASSSALVATEPAVVGPGSCLLSWNSWSDSGLKSFI